MADDKKIQFEEILNGVLKAERKNKNKAVSLIEWIKGEFNLGCCAAVVAGSKQSNNRIGEQFKKKQEVVVFVCEGDTDVDSLLGSAEKSDYGELKCVIAAVSEGDNFSYVLVERKDNAFSEWVKKNLSPLKIKTMSNASENKLLNSKDSYQKIFFGAPGTGKSFTVEKFKKSYSNTFRHKTGTGNEGRGAVLDEILSIILKVDSSLRNISKKIMVNEKTLSFEGCQFAYEKASVSELVAKRDRKNDCNTKISFIYEGKRYVAYHELYSGFDEFVKKICKPYSDHISVSVQGNEYQIEETCSNFYRTTFHPDYDNSMFKGVYRPVREEDVVTYRFCPQVFAKVYAAAWSHFLNKGAKAQNVYLIIEELNRGNSAQIFGDVFQLLDRDKAGYSSYSVEFDPDFIEWLREESDLKLVWKQYLEHNYISDLGRVVHPVSETTIALPPNLCIYATMNTSDQSLFPMDSAFKRRFDWQYVPIRYKNPYCEGSEEYEKWGAHKFKINLGLK